MLTTSHLSLVMHLIFYYSSTLLLDNSKVPILLETDTPILPFF